MAYPAAYHNANLVALFVTLTLLVGTIYGISVRILWNLVRQQIREEDYVQRIIAERRAQIRRDAKSAQHSHGDH